MRGRPGAASGPLPAARFWLPASTTILPEQRFLEAAHDPHRGVTSGDPFLRPQSGIVADMRQVGRQSLRIAEEEERGYQGQIVGAAVLAIRADLPGSIGHIAHGDVATEEFAMRQADGVRHIRWPSRGVGVVHGRHELAERRVESKPIPISVHGDTATKSEGVMAARAARA